MQWPVGVDVPQHAHLHRPHLDQDCGLPHCLTRPWFSSGFSSHQQHTSGRVGGRGVGDKKHIQVI